MISVWRHLTKRFSKKQRRSAEEVADLFRFKYSHFKDLLQSNTELAQVIADIAERLQGHDVFGMGYVRAKATMAMSHAARMVRALNALSFHRYGALEDVLERIQSLIRKELEAESEKAARCPDLVIPLEKVHRGMVDWVGGKSANLGEVAGRVGLKVPQGFAVTTRAFELFMDQGDLRDWIRKHKTETDMTSPAAVQEFSEAVQHLILRTPVPREIQEALEAAFREMEVEAAQSLGPGRPLRVAMRSSAIGEDSDLSFAGQYVSVLNVERDRLAETYRVIVASLYTPRAVSYRYQKGIRDEDTAMGVTVLAMIESVAAGVAYSMDPLRPNPDELLISGIWGLGPYAVEGVVTPDLVRVSKKPGFPILEKTVSVKPVKLVLNPDGGLREIPVPEADRARLCLEDEAVRRLAEAVTRLEDHFGCPQDVEWALDGRGEVYILQSRPLQILGTSAVDAPPEPAA
ncbi:MAG: PEP/pyruvate-binding domain-containing protein, partial [Desulfosoma sp.]